MSGNYHDAPHLRALIRNMFGDDQNPNEAGMNIRQQPQQQQIYTGYPPLGNAFSRTPSVMQQSPAAMGSMFGRTPSFMQQSPAAMGNMQYQPAASSLQGARRSIYDRTPSEIQQEEDLEIIIEDDSLNKDQIEDKLPNYFVPSWIRYKNAQRKKIPFSILIWSAKKNELRDLDELWEDYNGVPNFAEKKYDYNPKEYFAALLDSKPEVIKMVQDRSGTGIESYRNVLKFLLLYNLKRIHKIVEWDDTDPFSQGIPIYDSSPNKIFKNVKIQNIFDGGNLNPHEQELVTIMNEEAYSLYSQSRRPNITAQSSPFIDSDNYNVITNNDFFELVNTHFRIFLNRVTIRYWKSLKFHKQYGGKKVAKKPVKKHVKKQVKKQVKKPVNKPVKKPAKKHVNKPVKKPM
jgi:hypothetical protein